jgi:hypothetical protein
MRIMFYRSVPVLFALIFCAGHSSGQSFTARMNIGFGSYSMLSLRQLQDYRLKSAGLPAQITDNFPANWTSGIEAGLCFPKFPSRLSWFFHFSSTGARVSSVDYSGEMKLDMVANALQFGTCLEQDVWRIKFFSLSVSGKVSYLLTQATTLDYLRIYEQVEQTKYRLSANGGAFEPGLLAGFNIWYLRLGIYGGYLFSISEGLHLPNEHKAMLEMPDGKKVIPQWNGWRALITLDFRIPLVKKNAGEENKE